MLNISRLARRAQLTISRYQGRPKVRTPSLRRCQEASQVQARYRRLERD
jgi:hypothetical protein